MEYFCLDHPSDQLILCIRSRCENIADYLEVNEHGEEECVCAAHTSSVRHAAVLPIALPGAKPVGAAPLLSSLAVVCPVPGCLPSSPITYLAGARYSPSSAGQIPHSRAHQSVFGLPGKVLPG